MSTPSLNMQPAECDRVQAAALAAGEEPPAWWRPVPVTAQWHNRECVPCGVRWREGDACWMCGAAGGRVA